MSVLINMEMPKSPVLFCIHPDGKVFADLEGEWREYKAVPVPPHGRLIDIDAPYQIQVHVDGLTKKGSVDIYAPAVLEADPAEEGE